MTTTLRDIRQFLAPECGPFLASTSGASSTTTALLDPAWPVSSTLSQATLYQDHFLFRPSAVAATDRRRVVKTYVSGTGELDPDLPWGVAPANAEVYELHGTFDPAVLHLAINEALRTLPIPAEVTLTPLVRDATRHNLTTVLSWLPDSRWVYAVGWLASSDDRDEIDPYQRGVRGLVQRIGGSWYLNHRGQTFDPTDTLYLSTIRPAYYSCAAASGAPGSQSGLALDTDEVPIQAEWVAAAALQILWRRHSQVLMNAASDNEGLLRDRAGAAAWLSQCTARYFQEPVRTLQMPVVAWGPR